MTSSGKDLYLKSDKKEVDYYSLVANLHAEQGSIIAMGATYHSLHLKLQIRDSQSSRHLPCEACRDFAIRYLAVWAEDVKHGLIELTAVGNGKSEVLDLSISSLGEAERATLRKRGMMRTLK